MQFIEKIVFLLFLAIQNVCSMQNSDDYSLQKIMDDINMRSDLNEHQKDDEIMEIMKAASMNSLSNADQQNMQLTEGIKRKRAVDERRSSNQCEEKVQIQVDKCFCGIYKGNVEDEFEKWCHRGSYCYDAYTSKSLSDAACYDHRPCSESSPEDAEKNGDLESTCLCGSGHTECGPGNYCSEKGQCLSKTQRECERNTKVTDKKCMCGYKECPKRSVCVRREDIPGNSGYSGDQCKEFCDANAFPNGENGDCICSAPNSNPLKIKFCADTQTCKAVNDTPECTDVEEDEDEEDWDE